MVLPEVNQFCRIPNVLLKDESLTRINDVLCRKVDGFAGTLEPFSEVEIHMEMDMGWKWSGNGAQFVKIVWIGLDLGQSVALTPCDGHRTFTKRDKSNTETRLYLID